ncbi:hypothetical protein PHYSODRAFT_294063 [Phytophthora sojae]|uniref:Uncharacterized protein n=1 Tax=Phytophthora sojae (strain P6497) TaxID=1094619 RepID=G4YIU7_PHYSP|nr:hypothetical protein PHYSODRAFT_294063 [Phytophthora sojae]EGZ28517.1 hypothetical protein PHYSODRAFT_294063 [Phytophthora sojae]|eukprot:XP_009515792.1 hypothetical protein PHYSODRAFT_294063 [Phytophthora sojae]
MRGQIVFVALGTRAVYGFNRVRCSLAPQQTRHDAAVQNLSYLSFATEAAAKTERWGAANPFGLAVPLCGTRTTSTNEGENNALSWAGLRGMVVPSAVIAYCERVMKTLNSGHERGAAWTNAQCNISPRAKGYVKSKLEKVSKLTVQKKRGYRVLRCGAENTFVNRK